MINAQNEHLDLLAFGAHPDDIEVGEGRKLAELILGERDEPRVSTRAVVSAG